MSRRALTVLLALATAVACAPADRPRRHLPRALVVIVIDTLRCDRLGFYGGEHRIAPFLASLARRGVLFERAWSPSSKTAPATASIFTSLHTLQHGVETNLQDYRIFRTEGVTRDINRLPDAVETLPQVMQRLGYATFGIADNATVCRAMGFDRGFDRFLTLDYETAEKVNATLADWRVALRRAPRFFLYVHYMDPHASYHVRQPWFERNGPVTVLSTNPRSWAADFKRAVLTKMKIDPSDLGDTDEFLVKLVAGGLAAYESEIGYVDDHIKDMFDSLALDDDALVVITSDHGEEFFDHGGVYHPMQLYSELTHVPLIVYGMGFGPCRARGNVSTLDILPTLRDLLGAGPGLRDQGRSLRPLLEGQPGTPRPVFTMRLEEHSRRADEWKGAVILEDHKYIRSEPSGLEELYDLAHDPNEHENIISRYADLAVPLRGHLQHLRDDLPRLERFFLPASRAPDLRELDTLGYGK